MIGELAKETEIADSTYQNIKKICSDDWWYRDLKVLGYGI
jgi:hypothetical protein